LLHAPLALLVASLGVAVLAASDLGGFTRWPFAILHSAWHISGFTSVGWLLALERASSAALGVADVLVVGLGNPGYEYEESRHNLGARVVEILACRAGVDLCPAPGPSRAARTLRASGASVLLARPETYMNRSGRAVANLCKACGVVAGPGDGPPGERLIVVHDELDLPAGRLKVQRGGSEAGHNGVRSISARLGSLDFVRVRIGVGKPPKGRGPEWVLGRPDEDGDAAGALRGAATRAAEAVETLVDAGLERAMSCFNGRAAAVVGAASPCGDDGGGAGAAAAAAAVLHS